MKNKILVLSLLFTVTIIFAGCAKKETVTNSQTKQSQENQTQPTQSDKKEAQDDKKDTAYIIDYSNQKQLGKQDIELLDKLLLKYARNEIYARHGFIFKDANLQNYFDKKAWYIRNPDFKGIGDELSSIEKSNIAILKTYEEGKKESTIDRFINNYYNDTSPINWMYDTESFENEKGMKDIRKVEKQIGNMNIDMDGDSKPENILITGKYYLGTNSENYKVASNIKIIISINDKKIEWQPEYMTGIEVTDIDVNDGQKEIALFDNGPSDDPSTTYYAVRNGKIVEIGGIPGYGKVFGDGKISTEERSEFLTTHLHYAEFKLIDKVKLEQIPIEFYNYGLKTKAQRDMKLREEPKENSKYLIEVKKGENVEFQETNEKWLQIKNSKGEKGWILVTEGESNGDTPNSRYSIEGTGLTISDVFPELDKMYFD